MGSMIASQGWGLVVEGRQGVVWQSMQGSVGVMTIRTGRLQQRQQHSRQLQQEVVLGEHQCQSLTSLQTHHVVVALPTSRSAQHGGFPSPHQTAASSLEVRAAGDQHHHATSLAGEQLVAEAVAGGCLSRLPVLAPQELNPYPLEQQQEAATLRLAQGQGPAGMQVTGKYSVADNGVEEGHQAQLALVPPLSN